MAYGVLYEFAFESTNHADCLIQILKKKYTGEVIKRKLGRPPVLKRENKDRIYGTSCEIYAECVVDGEFSQLYTSSPYEFRVEVYRNNQLLWVGFVSPELYSEPDIAPPYDVQIIATDGLGELKDYTWNPLGLTTVQGILIELLGKSGLERSYYMASDLRYRNEYGSLSSPNQFLDIMLNLDHEEGETYYDVLQNLLSAFNFNISTYKDKWILFRETDFISDSADGRINIIDVNGYVVETEPGEFGSMRSCEYWPVGQLSINIDPAKNAVVLESPNHYKENILDFNSWSLSNNASYSETEEAFVLPAQVDMMDTGIYSELSQTISFDKSVAFLLGLKIKARKFGYVHSQSGIDVRVQMLGTVDGHTSTYWLKKPDISSGSPSTDYVWSLNYSSFEESIKGTQGGYATSADVQDVDIVIPLHDDGDNFHAKTGQLTISIFNSSLYDSIYVYDVSLVKYEQIEGYKANVKIDNNAREGNSDVNLSLTSGDRVPNCGELFMTGIPIQPSGNGVIKSWNTREGDQNYLSFMALDWGRSIGLPKMRYSGVLNMPGDKYDLPLLFCRDNTYYFPKNYSFDLYNDELNVELISISAADVSLSSVVISQIDQASGQTGGNSTGGGSTGGGYVPIPLDKEMSDTSDNAVENRVIKEYIDSKTSRFVIGEDDVLNIIGPARATDIFYANKGIVTDHITIGGVRIDVANGVLRVNGPLLTVGEFAAAAVGAEGGGSVGAAYLSDLYDVSLGSLLSGDLLSWNGSEWVNIKQSSLVPDLSAYASKSFVSDALSGYLPLSGGTMSGRLTISPKNYLGLVVDSPDVSLNQINLKALGELKGIFQYNSTYGVGFHYQDKGGIYVDEQEYPRFVDASLNVHTLLHSGNYSDYAVKYVGGSSVDAARHCIGYDNTSQGSANLPDVYGGGFISADQGHYGFQMLGLAGINKLYFRSLYNDTYLDWSEIIHSGNIGDYAITSSGEQSISGKKTIFEQYTDKWSIGGDVYNLTISRSGGWAATLAYIANTYGGSTAKATISAYGDSGTINYMYLGLSTDYNGNNLRISSDGVSFGGNTILHTGNIGSQSVAYASNAGTLGGYAASYASNSPFGTIPVVTQGGYLDIGRGIEFHHDNTGWGDYSTYLSCTGNHGNVVDLPSASGTLALTTDNVASATKLATPRTIWGQSFDGTGNVNGSINGDVADFQINANDGSARYNIIDADSNNAVLYFGYGSAPKSYKTRIAGETVILHYGTSKTTGLILNSAGNVTIGASDLAGNNFSLVVSGDQRIFRKHSNDTFLDITLGDVSAYYNGYDPDGWMSHYFQSNGKTCMSIIGHSGNVLIGSTTDRGHRLTVGRPDGAANLTSTTLNNSLLFVGMSESVDSYGTNFWTEGSGNGFIQQGRTDEEQPALYDLILQPFGRNVGIGRLPEFSLDVEGKMRVFGNTIIGASAYEDGRLRVVGEYGATNVLVATDYNGFTKFCVQNNGNVLIGTTTDSGYKLDVNGAAMAHRWLTSGDNGVWKGSHYTGSLGGNDLAIVGTNVWLFGDVSARNNLSVAGGFVAYGASTIASTLSVIGKTTLYDTLTAQNGITTNEITIGGIRIYVEGGVLKINGNVLTLGQFASAVAAN